MGGGKGCLGRHRSTKQNSSILVYANPCCVICNCSIITRLMATPETISVATRDPSVDDRLQIHGNPWVVTSRASYSNDKGYRTIEWCCEARGIEAYLLKEFEGDKPPR